MCLPSVEKEIISIEKECQISPNCSCPNFGTHDASLTSRVLMHSFVFKWERMWQDVAYFSNLVTHQLTHATTVLTLEVVKIWRVACYLCVVFYVLEARTSFRHDPIVSRKSNMWVILLNFTRRKGNDMSGSGRHVQDLVKTGSIMLCTGATLHG